MVPQYYDDTDYYDDDYLDDESSQPKSRSWMVSLSLATILALVVIGDTIGALVNVNNRTHIEFGQGVTLVLPCDNSVTVKPVAEYRTNGSDKEFLLDSLFISGLSDQCLKRLFQIKFYSLSGPPINIAYNKISGSSKFDTDAIKFLLSRKVITTAGNQGLNWYTYPEATGLGSPPAPPQNNGSGAPILCGGSVNATDVINFSDADWSVPPAPFCPSDNWLIHFQGYLNVPGVDDGELKPVNFQLESFGNSELWIDENRVIADNSTRSVLTASTGGSSLRRGQSYLLDYWVFKGTGSGAAILKWNLDSSGTVTSTYSVVPDTAFYSSSQDLIEIAPTEGTTDYTVESVSSAINDRSVKIVFTRPVSAQNIRFLTIETS